MVLAWHGSYIIHLCLCIACVLCAVYIKIKINRSMHKYTQYGPFHWCFTFGVMNYPLTIPHCSKLLYWPYTNVNQLDIPASISRDKLPILEWTIFSILLISVTLIQFHLEFKYFFSCATFLYQESLNIKYFVDDPYMLLQFFPFKGTRGGGKSSESEVVAVIPIYCEIC